MTYQKFTGDSHDCPYGPLLTSGYHLVNRLAYFSSAKPVPEDVIVDEAPDVPLVACDACDAAWDSDLYEGCPYGEDAGRAAYRGGHQPTAGACRLGVLRQWTVVLLAELRELSQTGSQQPGGAPD